MCAHTQKENVDEDILSIGAGPLAVELDIMQPLDPNRAPKVLTTNTNKTQNLGRTSPASSFLSHTQSHTLITYAY
jgi:hypothetical protein